MKCFAGTFRWAQTSYFWRVPRHPCRRAFGAKLNFEFFQIKGRARIICHVLKYIVYLYKIWTTCHIFCITNYLNFLITAHILINPLSKKTAFFLYWIRSLAGTSLPKALLWLWRKCLNWNNICIIRSFILIGTRSSMSKSMRYRNIFLEYCSSCVLQK